MPTISADSDRDVLDDAHARKAERTKGGDFAEPLVDRDSQQHGDEKHGKRHGHRREHARDLSKVGEAGLLEAPDDLAVGRGPDLGVQRAMAAAVPSASPVDVTRIRSASLPTLPPQAVLSASSVPPVVLSLVVERKLRDADDRQAVAGRRFEIGDARRRAS